MRWPRRGSLCRENLAVPPAAPRRPRVFVTARDRIGARLKTVKMLLRGLDPTGLTDQERHRLASAMAACVLIDRDLSLISPTQH